MESYKPALSAEEFERLGAYAARHVDLDAQFARAFRDAQQEAYEGWAPLNDDAVETSQPKTREPSRRVDTAVRGASISRSRVASRLMRGVRNVAAVVLFFSVGALAIPSTREVILQRLFLPYFVNWSPPSAATPGITYSYRVQATEPAGIPLEYSLEGAPAGMTIDPSTGIIHWEPPEGEAGQSHRVTVKVDAARGIARTFEVRVNPAVAPTKAAAPNTPIAAVPPAGNIGPSLVNFNPYTLAAEGTIYRYTVEASDPEHDPLTFSLPEAPAGMKIDPSSGLILWTPTAGQAAGSPYIVTVQVADPYTADPMHVVPQKYQLTVRATGMQPPPGNIGPFFVNWSPTLRATESTQYTYSVLGRDPENDPIVFSLSTAPDGMSIDPAAGVIAWTPPIGAASGGPYSVTVEVSDPYTADRTHLISRTFQLTVDPASAKRDE